MSRPCKHKECREPLEFLTTAKGRLIPVAAKSLTATEREVLRGGCALVFNRALHRPHHADCPGAKEFRRPRKGPPPSSPS